MASVKIIIVFLAFVLALAVAAPAPGYLGHGHEHIIIHAPYRVHTVHHHHVKKVHVPVPVVKKVIIQEDIHHLGHGGWW